MRAHINKDTNSHPHIYICFLLDRFRELSRGNMPLGMKTIEKANSPKKDKETSVRNAALRLIKYERELLSDKITRRRERKRSKESIGAAFGASFYDGSKDESTSGLNYDANGGEIASETSVTDEAGFEGNAVSLKKRKTSNLRYDKPGDKGKKSAYRQECRNSESRIRTDTMQNTDRSKSVKHKTNGATYRKRGAKYREMKPVIKCALSEKKIAPDRETPSKNVSVSFTLVSHLSHIFFLQ